MATPAAPRDPELQEAHTARGPFAYTSEGAGPAVVAIHGLPGSSRDYRWLGAALPPTVRFVRLDLPGFGGTKVSTAPGPSIDERGAFVVEALSALRLERCVLVGHSMGGPVALSAAVQSRGAVTALALLSSVGLRPHRLMRRFVGRHLFARAVDAPLLAGPTRALLRAAFRSVGFPAQTRTDEVAHTVRCVSAVDFEVQARNTAAFRQPTLSAWADDDAFIEPAVFEQHAAALPAGPRLRWPSGGHNIQKSHAVELGEALTALTVG
ncbi:MAG: alpha/beta fold hydrolase [Myxococcaceae bacterium]|nr:alpha/beta fold hydrolase [Myxococcaceae bacterium]